MLYIVYGLYGKKDRKRRQLLEKSEAKKTQREEQMSKEISKLQQKKWNEQHKRLRLKSTKSEVGENK
jgi:hypothetical protein